MEKEIASLKKSDTDNKNINESLRLSIKVLTKKTNPNLGISGAVVNILIKPYLNRGHTLFIDNWYSSQPSWFQCINGTSWTR